MAKPDPRLEEVLRLAREIDAGLPFLIALSQKMIEFRAAMLTFEAHGIGYAGTSSYEDGPEDKP